MVDIWRLLVGVRGFHCAGQGARRRRTRRFPRSPRMAADAYRAALRRTPGGVTRESPCRWTRLAADLGYGDEMSTLGSMRQRSIRQALGHMDPLLIDGIATFVVFALMAGQFIGTRQLKPGQHPTTALTSLLAVLICAPILTHRRFPRASVVVCLAAVVVYATGGLRCLPRTRRLRAHLRHRPAQPGAGGRGDPVRLGRGGRSV